MGLRFRRSFRLFPGVRVNVSKTGLSASFGGRGATLNVGPKGVKGTVGIPGTGLSYSQQLGRKPPPAQPADPSGSKRSVRPSPLARLVPRRAK
jgi:hypothetical protein